MISVPNRAEVMKKVLVRVNKPNLNNKNLLGFGNDHSASFSTGVYWDKGWRINPPGSVKPTVS